MVLNFIHVVTLNLKKQTNKNKLITPETRLDNNITHVWCTEYSFYKTIRYSEFVRVDSKLKSKYLLNNRIHSTLQ